MIEFLTVFGLAFKLALLIYQRNKSTPAETRRSELALLDEAIDRAVQLKDAKDLAKWMAGKI